MDELEKLKRAKQYMQWLANGIDPITQTELPEDTALNNVRLSRCFFYVADILAQVIDNGGTVSKPKIVHHQGLPPFSLTPEQKARVEASDDLLFISRFAEKINALTEEGTMKKLKAAAFGAWLQQQGYLQEEIHNGSRHRMPSQAGRQLGITSEFRQTERGTYTALFYNRQAQQLLLDHLDEIIAISNG